MEIGTNYSTDYPLLTNYATTAASSHASADNSGIKGVAEDGSTKSIASSADTVSFSEQALALAGGELASNTNSNANTNSNTNSNANTNSNTNSNGSAYSKVSTDGNGSEDKSTLLNSTGKVDNVALGVVITQAPPPETTKILPSQDKVTISQEAQILAASMAAAESKVQNATNTPSDQQSKENGSAKEQDTAASKLEERLGNLSGEEDADLVQKRIQELMQRMQEIIQEMAALASDEQLSEKEKEIKQVELQTELQAIQTELEELNKKQG